MRTLEVALIEWPDGLSSGSGPRVLGHVSDPKIITEVQDRIAAQRRRELARLVADGKG